eukprot:1678113-Alexandrium_andersonii.AAC.1
MSGCCGPTGSMTNDIWNGGGLLPSCLTPRSLARILPSQHVRSIETAYVLRLCTRALCHRLGNSNWIG